MALKFLAGIINLRSKKIMMNFLNQARLLKLFFEGTPVDREKLDSLIIHLTKMLSPLPSSGLILLQEKNPLNFMLTFLALLDQGLTPVALPADLSVYALEQISKDMDDPSTLVDGVLKVGKGSREIPFKGCYASLTSGTTGAPKLCYLKVENALKNARSHCESLSITHEDEVIQTLPLYHSYGLVAYVFGWLQMKFTLDLNNTFLGLRALSKRKIHQAVLNISPAQLRFMLKEKGDIPQGIKLISIGGGSIDQESVLEFSKKLPDVKLYLTYGLTEAGPRVSTGLWKGQETGYIGEAISEVQVAVLDDGVVRKSGTGKLLIFSPTLKLNLESHELHEGHLVTRDLVTIDDSGSIYFKTRDDDLINFGGISVYPIDIETVARQHPDVLDAQVLKMKSKMYEEEPVLFVEPEMDAEVLRDFLKDKLSLYQMPKKIIALTKLPRTSLNKVDRKVLKEKLESL
jgi:long-chain acyl-CoA synthetase